MSRCTKSASTTIYLWMALDHAVLAHIHPVLVAELVRHVPLRTFAQTHD